MMHCRSLSVHQISPMFPAFCCTAVSSLNHDISRRSFNTTEYSSYYIELEIVDGHHILAAQNPCLSDLGDTFSQRVTILPREQLTADILLHT